MPVLDDRPEKITIVDNDIIAGGDSEELENTYKKSKWWKFSTIKTKLATILESLSNKVTSLSAGSTDTQYPSAKLTYDQLALKEVLTNKETSALDTSTTKYPCNNVVKTANDLKQAVSNLVTSISSGSTDVQYGSAKLLYDQLLLKLSLDSCKLGVGHLVDAIKNSTGDANNDIDFIAGIRQVNQTGTRIMLSTAMTKKSDAVFVAGTNQGMMDRILVSGLSNSRARASGIATLTMASAGDFIDGTYYCNISGFGETGYNLNNVLVTVSGSGAVYRYASPGVDETTEPDAGGNITTGKKDGCTLHFFEIGKTDATTDYLASLSLIPTLPSGFVDYARIWSTRVTTADVNIPFSQEGKYNQWLTPITILNGETPSNTNRQTIAMSSPLGVTVRSNFSASMLLSGSASGGYYLRFTSLTQTDESAVAGRMDLAAYAGSADNETYSAGNFTRETNTSSQISYRSSSASEDLAIYIRDLGYEDFTL